MSTDDEDWFEREQLHFASADGDLESVRKLLREGRDINAFDRDLSWTPLHHAAQEENLLVVQLLIDSGADVNAHDEEKIGETPLGQVASRCSATLARILLEAGADPTIEGWMGLTAIDRARERQDPAGKEVLELLLTASERRERK